MNDTQEKVLDLIRETETIDDVDALTPASSLYSAGLDSLAGAQLMVMLEDAFDVTFPQTADTFTRLDTVGGIRLFPDEGVGGAGVAVPG
jgi:acyl carrier protein